MATPKEPDPGNLSMVFVGRLYVPDELVIPPVHRAPDSELAQTARLCAVMGRLADFVEWVGDGPPLTASYLRLGDIRSLVGCSAWA